MKNARCATNNGPYGALSQVQGEGYEWGQDEATNGRDLHNFGA
jgi:hypothetical protein